MPKHSDLKDGGGGSAVRPPGTLTRRDALKLAAAAVLPQTDSRSKAAKRIIVAGAGIGGLSAAWELVRRGHDVTVLEASARTGGHVFTFRDGLDDGLYADGGAEHFTEPGYERFREYVREFNLPYVYYPRRENLVRWIGGQRYTEDMLADRQVLGKLGLNRREIEYLTTHPFPELAGLYFAPYVDSFADEYKPFDAGLNALDQISSTDLFRKDGASAAALGFIGGSGSALQAVWHAAILKLRGVPLFPPKVYRLLGGNQTLTDTFEKRLGSRIRLRSPLTAIEHGQTGVRVSCRNGKETAWFEADYLVCAMSARMLQLLPVTPALPAAKVVRHRARPVLSRYPRHPADPQPVLGARRPQPEHGVRRKPALPRVERVAGSQDHARAPRGNSIRCGHRGTCRRDVPEVLSGPLRRH